MGGKQFKSGEKTMDGEWLESLRELDADHPLSTVRLYMLMPRFLQIGPEQKSSFWETYRAATIVYKPGGEQLAKLLRNNMLTNCRNAAGVAIYEALVAQLRTVPYDDALLLLKLFLLEASSHDHLLVSTREKYQCSVGIIPVLATMHTHPLAIGAIQAMPSQAYVWGYAWVAVGLCGAECEIGFDMKGDTLILYVDPQEYATEVLGLFSKFANVEAAVRLGHVRRVQPPPDSDSDCESV